MEFLRYFATIIQVNNKERAQVKRQLATTSRDATWNNMQRLMNSRLDGLVPKSPVFESEKTASRSLANV
jgi:hypothetical protein